MTGLLAGDAFAVATSGDWEGLPTRTDVALLDIEDGGSLR